MDVLKKYESCCRFCLSFEIKSQINDALRPNLTIGQTLQTLLNYDFEFAIHTELSQSICAVCESHLILLDNFKTKCIQSDKILKSIFIENEPKVQSAVVKDEGNEHVFDDKFDETFTEAEEEKNEPKNLEPSYAQLSSTPNKLIRHEIVQKTPDSKKSSPKSKSPMVDDLHICEVCYRSFRTSWRLKEHLSIHANIQSYSCKDCNAIFNIKLKRDVHQQKMHPNKIQCNLCLKEFVAEKDFDQHNLDCHLKDVDCEEVYMCNECGREFKLKFALKRHLYKHFGITFQCKINFCGKIFATYNDLRRHEIFGHELPKRQTRLSKILYADKLY